MAKILVLSILFIGIAILLLGFKVFFTKDGRFPSSHVSAQPKLREKGLSCHRSQDMQDRVRMNLYERIKKP